MSGGRWRLAVRNGSDVEKLRFETLDEAIAATAERIDRVHREGGLPPISALRDFAPGQRVHARLEIGGQGLRAPSGGIDVMGDGSVVAYEGGVRKRVLGADTVDEALECLRDALRR